MAPMLIDYLVDPNVLLVLLVLVGVATSTLTMIKPEVAWRRGGHNVLDAVPPRLAAVLSWTTRVTSAVVIVVLVVFPFL